MQDGECCGEHFRLKARFLKSHNLFVAHAGIACILALGRQRTQVDITLISRCTAIVLIVAIRGYICRSIGNIVLDPIHAGLEVKSAERLVTSGGESYHHARVVAPLAVLLDELRGGCRHTCIHAPFRAIVGGKAAACCCRAAVVVVVYHIFEIVGLCVGIFLFQEDRQQSGGRCSREIVVLLTHGLIVGMVEHNII